MSIQKTFKLIALSLLTPFIFAFCKSAEKSRPVAWPTDFDWQGHRGCRGLMPENSVPAFVRAVDFQEVTTLELDVAVSKDRQLIVSHEPWFNPAICTLPGGDSIPKRDEEKYLIFERTVAEIRAFDCGSRGNARFADQQKMATHKPTLRETVEAVQATSRGKSMRWNIEIKSRPDWDGIRTPPVEEFARLLLDEMRTLGIEKQATVQSFDVRALQAVKKLDPQIRLAYLVEPQLFGLDLDFEKLGFQPDIFSPYYLFVNKKVVRRCHKRGVQVIPWTVNDVPAMRRLIRLGVDGIITDYPDKIGEVEK